MQRKLPFLTLAFVLVGALALTLGSQPARAQATPSKIGGGLGIDSDMADWQPVDLDPDDYRPMPLPHPDQPVQPEPPRPPQPPKPPRQFELPQELEPETPTSSGQLETGPSEFDPNDYQPMPLPEPKQPEPPRPPKPPRQPGEPVEHPVGQDKPLPAARQSDSTPETDSGSVKDVAASGGGSLIDLN